MIQGLSPLSLTLVMHSHYIPTFDIVTYNEEDYFVFSPHTMYSVIKVLDNLSLYINKIVALSNC